MTDMFIRDFTKAAKEEGIDRLNYYVETVERAAMEFVHGEVWTTEQSQNTNCFVQGEYQGNCGHSYIGDFDRISIREGLENIMQIAEVTQDRFYPVMIDSEMSASVQPYKLSDQKVLKEEIITAEKLAAEKFPSIKQFECHYREEVREIRLQNEKGEYISETEGHVSVAVAAEAEGDGLIQTAYITEKVAFGSEPDMSVLFFEAAQEAIGLLNSSPVAYGRYPVILKNTVVNEMFGMFAGTLCADMVHQKLSKFTGRLGEKVAASLVNLVEDPKLSEGIIQRRFDDEGVPTMRKEIIKDGILMMYLYNQEEARKDGCVSTGNGFKADYKSKAGVHVTNLKMIGEEKTRTDLLRQMGDGLYIVSCDGMFAGADVVSGDFSLISKGYLIKDGEIERAVNQITVAGNFFDMMGDIQGVANDHLIGGDRTGAVIVPSVYVKELVISGS
ncbi:MAG: TldD/PmbA family protein [Lachnospiraceae bacterium]|nr:TldD/PmbA family protein [Lachnospiraceae bacterium]